MTVGAGRALTGPDHFGTSRVSRLGGPELLAHADLHNHTWLSDGRGDPALALPAMRAAGLDAAALTDHSVFSSSFGDALSWFSPVTGIDEEAWRRLGELADASDDPDSFVALRGFEWSHPLLGHLNVWYTDAYTDPLRTLDVDLTRFYDWLSAPGRRDRGIASFNHPRGRGTLFAFLGFRFRARVAQQVVALEMFNKRFDYLYSGVDRGGRSPLVVALDAGWRPGLTGVSDHHGKQWGRDTTTGRTGLYVTELTRDGVRQALLARRAFATRERGLRLDARLAGGRMGSPVRVPPDGEPLLLEVDIDRGEQWWGRELSLQVLVTGRRMPGLALARTVRVPGPDDPVIRFWVPAGAVRGRWAVLRVSDPAVPADTRARGVWRALGSAVAYASPWWLIRDRRPSAPVRVTRGGDRTPPPGPPH